MERETTYTWNIDKIENETPLIKNFYLTPANSESIFTYTAGQYLTVRLPNIGPAEGKAYSISSAPHESKVRLSVKQMGDFSKALLSLHPGDSLISSAPYGFFYPEPEEVGPLVFVVGGIGITPCLSIIKNMVYTNSDRPLYLYYSNQTEADIAFYKELAELKTQHKLLSITHYITREKDSNPIFQLGRMHAVNIINTLDLATEPEIFICGTIDFTKALWKEFVAAGIPQHQLYTEGFF